MSDYEWTGAISWPEGIDTQFFLTHYWQKKPLLIRQAFPGFQTPLPADELAGLSLEPDTTPRLITQDATGAYHLEYGPFTEDRFSLLTDNNWSLLVTDVDKHLPELATYLEPFLFLPSWRIDDLMVSYAPEGASVGAHVDEYDVFLLQASGNRLWSIDELRHSDHDLVADADLKLLASFDPTDTWELMPGDMLYLPPGVGHHGIAGSTNCTTWSIGFRAPKLSDMLLSLTELISERLPDQRFTDGSLQPARPGEITKDATERLRDMWRKAVDLDSSDFACLLGQWLTESITPVQEFTPANADTTIPADLSKLRVAPFCRLAWTDTSSDIADMVTLFVDGMVSTCSRDFAISLCTSPAALEANKSRYSAADLQTLQRLQMNGSLHTGD